MRILKTALSIAAATALLVGIAGCASQPTVHVFLIAGQSNATPVRFVEEPRPDTRIQRWEDGKLVTVDEKLSYLGSEFARAFLAEHPDDRVVLVDASLGSTGFTTSSITPTPDGYNAGPGTWDRDLDDPVNLYRMAVDDTTAALDAAGGELDGIIWSQGESDTDPLPGGEPLAPAAYAENLDALISDLRSDLDAPDAPFILGSMTPEFIIERPAAATLMGTIRDTPNRVDRTATFEGPAAMTIPDQSVHYSGEGQQVRGDSAYQAWASITGED